MKSVFFIKIYVKDFYIQTWFKCETKRFFSVDHVKIIELHVVQT